MLILQANILFNFIHLLLFLHRQKKKQKKIASPHFCPKNESKKKSRVFLHGQQPNFSEFA